MINDEINEMRQYLSKLLPNWEKATAETLLTALSNCDNQQVKESAELIKLSSKSKEMMMLLDFALSMPSMRCQRRAASDAEERVAYYVDAYSRDTGQ